MRSGNYSLAALGLIESALKHLVGHGVGEQNQQIRSSYLVAQTSVHLGIYLSLTAIRLTEILILSDHTFITAYYYNTHLLSPFRRYTAPQSVAFILCVPAKLRHDLLLRNYLISSLLACAIIC